MFFGQNTKKKRRDGRVKGIVRKPEPGHIHLAQLDLSGGTMTSSFRPREHSGADVDPDNCRRSRIKREISAGSDTRIQDAARESLKEQRPDPAVPTVFERQFEQVVDRRDPPISLEIGRHYTEPVRPDDRVEL